MREDPYAKLSRTHDLSRAHSGTPKSRGTVPGPTLGVRQVGPIPTRARAASSGLSTLPIRRGNAWSPKISPLT
jgi:hypothetical protein